MGDDLSNFIESQKKKLERERMEIHSRTANEVQNDDSSDNRMPMMTRGQQAEDSEVENTGLQLGGYEKVQQKLRKERKEEYIKFLAEKNMRCTGKIDPILVNSGRSPIPPASGSRKEPSQQGDDDSLRPPQQLPESHRFNSNQPPRSRRRDKENVNVEDFPRVDDYYGEQGVRGRPENLFERYEDILRRKRAEERRYRGFYDEPELDSDIRSMKLNTPRYKFSSRSDGYLSRYDDDDDLGYDLRRSRRRKWDANPRRVRFDDEMDIDDTRLRGGTRHQQKLMIDDDYDNDNDDLIDWVRRRGIRGLRRSSAHEERHKPKSEQPAVERSHTDSNIRSQSAPLTDGKGLFGDSEDPRIAKAKKQKQYKKELEAQIKEQEEMKRRERHARLGADQPHSESGSQVQDKKVARLDQYKDAEQTPIHFTQQVTNYGPSSRPPAYPSLYTSPYEDPYCYYGNADVGVPNGPSAGAPLVREAQFASAVRPGVTVDGVSRGRVTPGVVEQVDMTGHSTTQHTSTLVSNPPGGQSNFNFGGGPGIEPGGTHAGATERKRAKQQAYQEQLRQQMYEKEERRKKEKEEREKYEMKKEEEIRNYNPWGKGGGGAPLRNTSGQLITNLNLMHKLNQEGKIVSPRDEPPSVERQFEMNPDSSPISDALMASTLGSLTSTGFAGTKPDAAVKTSPFGRSDPLKEIQPGDEMKRTAKMEYQEYLKQQVLEKERKKKEEEEKRKREEELEEKRLEDQRRKMQEEFEKEQEERRKKEEETRLKNAELQAMQEAKKREADRKKRDMEDKRQAELKRKLDEEMASKKTSTYQEARTNSPPIPTMRKDLQNEAINVRRTESPPVPTLASKQFQDTKPVSSLRNSGPSPSVLKEPDQDILSQLTALRQQLKNEENKVQSQMNRTTTQGECSSSKVTAASVNSKREDVASRRSRRDANVFERAMANKAAVTKKDSETFSAAEEFNRMKYEDTSSLAGEFRSRFPQPATTSSTLDLQQQAYLREQEDKLGSLRSDFKPPVVTGVSNNAMQGPARSGSKTSLLESESQFIAVDDTTGHPPSAQMNQAQTRQSSARERRRWKQLEEMAKNTKPFDSYKPPTPGGFSLNSVTSFNVDNVALKNEERLRRLEAIRKDGEKEDPDQVLNRFINRPLTRASEDSLEADTFYRPIN